MRWRDLSLLDLPGGDTLVVACDSAGGVGPKSGDVVKVAGYISGRFTARVALMEVLCAGARPILLVNTAAVEPNPTGEEILRGIVAEAALAGLGPELVTGSFEKNIPTVQTGLGVTVLGLAATEQRVAKAGDLVVAIGRPKVGEEVGLDDPEIADLPLVRQLLAEPDIHDLLPVGSRGIAAEAADLAASAGLEPEWLEPEEGWVYSKSAGPSTCLLAAVAPRLLPALALRLDRPWAVVAQLAAPN